MIHYHGTPITPLSELQKMAGRNFCVSYMYPGQVNRCHEIGQSVMLDNGAFTAWTKNLAVSWYDYYKWCEGWLDYHTTWAIIPDIIDGSEEQNNTMIIQWPHGDRGAPVWHLHESIDRLKFLCDHFSRVCFGSSGQYSEPGADGWNRRMCEAFDAIAPNGTVPVWTHMLRGLKFSGESFPFASVDSAHIARNHHRDGGVEVMVDTWDAKQCPARWAGCKQMELECTG